MFPTFISILDVQSWWEVPSIAHFCSLFRTAFNLLDFDIEDLEEALLTDGTEETSWLQELIVQLLNGCLPNNEISTFNYQMFLRRLFREKCKEHDRYNPFNTDIDFQLLPLRTKVDILHALCDFRLDSEDVLEQLKNLEADSLRVEPLGYDTNESAYWYFYGTRLYREDFNNRNNKKGKSVWQVVCFTEDDWFHVTKKFKKSQCKEERQLYRTLTENFLPELPRLFREKEKLARKRLLENQPRRTSDRLKTISQTKQDEEAGAKKAEEPAPEAADIRDDLIKRRQEAYERRAKLKEEKGEEELQQQHQREQQEEVEKPQERYEMAGNRKRDKKSEIRQRKNSSGSSSSRDYGGGTTGSSNRPSNKDNGRDKNKTSPNSGANAKQAGATLIGRQTNNSLACATGQIVIQPVANTNRKKLKTSQVFHQSDEDLLTGMHKILDYIKDHEDAWPFIDPVEEEYAPNYYTIIRKPMDLQRMEDRLDSGFYKSFSRFQADFQLIVDNCRLYNGVDNEYTEMVSNLSKAFEKATERYLDQSTSSDEEIAVEFPETDDDSKLKRKRMTEPSKRKPTLAAQTDKKRSRSASEETLANKSDSLEYDTRPKNDKKTSKTGTKSAPKGRPGRPRKIKNTKVVKKPSLKSASPYRSRSNSVQRYSSSPPPSSIESDTEIVEKKPLNDGTKHKDEKKTKYKCKEESRNEHKDKSIGKNKDDVDVQSKQKDKHNKLRETIEKLKAKSEISNKIRNAKFDDSDGEKIKENVHVSNDVDPKKSKKGDIHKGKNKYKIKASNKSYDYDDENSIAGSLKAENKKHKKTNMKNSGTKNNVAIEALTLATEQTLKDINKWLDDMVSSASNSPSHHIAGADEFDSFGNKIEQDYRKHEKPYTKKDMKRRPPPHRDPSKFFKRREVQRTIDRLQPGKSKGNLLSNIQNCNKIEDTFALGVGLASKIKDTKNSLIVKTDESTPKLSLGSVLDSFGKHKFVDDVKKDVVEKPVELDDGKTKTEVDPVKSAEKENEDKVEEVKEVSAVDNTSLGKATPNLSAWFKAFGVTKVAAATSKKAEATKSDVKESETAEESKKTEQKLKVTPPDPSPSLDSPSTPQSHGAVPRQRRMSTGSTVSERSSFSQDMDSPRIGIDERLGAYPAPYPSPLHRSPSGASPVLASPRPDVSPKAAAYPTVNGQIRVGFYQDTVSTKSSPDKSCSPRDNPQSPYTQYSEHVYTPSSTATTTYSYTNPPYYSHYSSPAPIGTFNSDQNTSYYDTSKPLTDQYQQNKSSSAFTSVNVQNYQSDGTSPICDSDRPSQQSTQNYEAYRQQQQQPKLADKQSTIFPVKKRAYNETESVDSNQVEMYGNSNRNYELNSQNSEENKTKVQDIQMKEGTESQIQVESTRIGSYSAANQNLYGYDENPSYVGMQAERPLDLNARPSESERKIDLSKYTNMGYTGPDVSNYARADNYNRGVPANKSSPQNDMMLRYPDPTSIGGYRNAELRQKVQNPTDNNLVNVNANVNYKPEVSVPRPPYPTNTLNMDQSLGLRGNIPNLSHIVDRYASENIYYADKGLYNKPMATSTASLPIFSQPNMTYSQEMQATQASMYNRPIAEQQQLQHQQQQVPLQPEKKTKRRKNAKTPPTSTVDSIGTSNQGFQSYAGLKDSSAISLKTASVVPGSAFNFGPTPTGLGLASGLYGDKDAYPNLFEDYRSAPNYYMAAAAAAAHHRATPEGTEKQARAAHQPPATAAATYPFIGAPQARPSYPFMPPQAAGPLMDASSPIYQQYLQAGVLHQGLLGAPGTYPPGYLSMRQPFDSMTRPSWL